MSERKPEGCGCESYPHTCHSKPSHPARERDIVERLRLFGVARPNLGLPICDEAAAEITRLRELEAPSPQPDTDVVERVARAIDPHAFNDPTGDSYVEARICRAFEKARAAIAALNASTPEIQRMREALRGCIEHMEWSTPQGREAYNEASTLADFLQRPPEPPALKQDEENHDK